MRYQNLRAFKKHLSSAAPDHLSRCYLVAVPDDYERGVVLSAILSYFPESSQVCLSGATALYREIADALVSPSLFGGEPLVVLDELEKMGKKELQPLSDLISKFSLYGYLLCATRCKTSLLSAFEKAGVILDLLEEKPWEREKRLSEQIAERVATLGKRIAPDASLLFFERVGTDAALVDSEIDKLICFVGEKPTIERSDVFRISTVSRSNTFWQIAEELVWEGASAPIDASMFHSLIPALRSQLQIGMKIRDLVALGIPRDDWSAHLPRLWPKVLEKRSLQAIEMRPFYFQKGLDLLFEIELLSRTDSACEAALLDFFRISLHHARR